MRHALVLALALLVGGVGAGLACSFPSPELRDLATPDATRDGETKADAKLDPDADVDADIPFDAEVDASIAFDAPPPLTDASQVDGDATVAAGDGAVVNCDEDGDRFAKIGGVCGGLDCDDTDRRVRPDQDFTTFAPIAGSGPGKNGDWNCSGEVEVRGEVGVNASCPGSAFLGCAKEGFVAAAPACGTNARYVKCTVKGLGCTKSFDQLLPVACR